MELPAVSAKPAPPWLVYLTVGSVGLAMLSFGALLWAKWGIVLTMTEDVLKYCFG